MTATPNPDGLSLEDLAWLRRLALHLVRDECEADDLAQEAVLKALDAGRIAAPRSWWRAVLQNAARDRVRSGVRRRDHELATPTGGEPPTPHAVVEAAETQQRVAEAVLALDEPHRTVLLLRYFEGLPPRRIARELERPPAEIKAQLEAGRARLRRRLGREFGRGGALAVALLPIAGADRAAAATGALAAGIVMTKGTWIAIAVAGAFIAAMIGRHDTEPLKKDVGRTTGGIREDVPLAAPARVEGRRRAEPVPSEARRSSESPTTPAIALDLDGRPMAAVKLLLKRDGEAVVEVTTDVEGRFEMRTDRTIEAADETLAALAYRDLDGLREVRLAQTVRVAGEVVDVDGRPVDRGYVADRSSAARAGLALDPRSPYVGLYRSLAGEFWPDNRFDLGHVATWPGKTLRVHSVLGTLDVPVPPADTTELRIVFPGSLESDSITVRVIDERGRPATDGAVSIGHVARPTDDSGTATFELGRDNDARTIVAIRHGFVPVSVPRPSGGDVEVEVAVTERGRSVTGLVVDADGAPVAGAEVVVWDGGVPFGRYAVAELVDDLDVDWSLPFETDAEGRFEISSLADGPYTLRALAPDPLRIGTARDVVPGDDVVIRLPDASGAIPIEGRVVDVSGRPVQDARVQAGATKRRWREGEWLNSLADPYNAYFLAHSNSFISITDADGRFRLPDLAQEGLLLFAEKDSARASVEATARDLTIVLDCECPITVNLEPSSRQHRLAAVDASGRFLRYRRKDRSLVLSPGVVPFGSGSLDLTVPQSTVALVLLERGNEVSRVAIEPDPAVRLQVRL